MGFRELTMVDVKEILRRWQDGQSVRRIARESGSDRKTVDRYLDAAKAEGVTSETTLDEKLIASVANAVQSRPAMPPSESVQSLEPHRERIREWLTRERPLKLSKVHVLLQRAEVNVSYSTLRRFAISELGWREPPSTVLLSDPPAGQEAQVDYGKMGFIPDGESGHKRLLWALIVTLSCSRYQFVWPSWQQTTAALIEGLEAAWHFFGGMPRTLLPDNMSSAVVHADAQSPTLSLGFADYVQARGIFVDPARVRRPQDKARVENQVAFVRESWFDGEQFSSLEQARLSAMHWCAEIAGRRVHGTTRKIPREVFEQHEQAAMLAAPSEHYDVPRFVTAKVHPDHHVQVDKALYSVPTAYLHKEVTVRVDQRVVKIFLGAQLIKLHARVPAGSRSTDVQDYPSEKQAYAMRSVDVLLAKAQKVGPHVGSYAERLLGGPLPWTRMRQAQALLSLVERFGAARVEAVCQTALTFDVIDVRRIGGMLKRAAVAEQSSEEGKVIALPAARFARPAEHFATMPATRRERA